MDTSSQNIGPETSSTSIHRKVSFLEWLGIATLLFPIACLLLYVATSPCTLVGQWHDFLRTVSLLPMPSDVTRLSARQGDGTPILGLGQASADLYGELYITSIEPATLIAFYQAHEATCEERDHGTDAYWSCELIAPPSGSGRVDILTQEVYRRRPDVGDVGITSYNLSAPVPTEGTILRTWVVWCADK